MLIKKIKIVPVFVLLFLQVKPLATNFQLTKGIIAKAII